MSQKFLDNNTNENNIIELSQRALIDKQASDFQKDLLSLINHIIK